MGVIARQSIKGSIYNYLGAVVAFLNIGLLMPLLFNTNQVGLINILLAMSSIIAQFSTLGVNYVNIRLFPYFKTKDKTHHGFLRLLLIFALAGLAMSMTGYLVFKEQIISNNQESSPLLAENVAYLIPMIIASLTYLVLDGYFRSIYKASTSMFFKEFFMRILIFAGLIMYYFGWIDFKMFLNYYIIAFLSPSILMIMYLFYIGEFKLKGSFEGLPSGIWRLVVSVAFFGMISGFTNIAIMNMDKYFINHYLDLSSTGIYAISFYFGMMILIPGKAMRSISAPVLSNGFRENDLNQVKLVYDKSNLNMFLGGIILFVFLWANIDNILRILPEEYAAGKWVVFIIGMAFLMNMVSGLSNQIILYSNAYRLHAFSMLGLLVILIVSNLVLIPIFGLIGAALATLITYTIDMVFKWAYIWYKFKIQPFKRKHLFSLALTLAIYSITVLIPELPLIPDILLRCLIIAIAFVLSLRYFNLSEDISAFIDAIIKKLRR
ncbi:MAG: polysaccharide biosynthesis C-terminal domain-containing protein [Bacteroidota bacterium]|nr:polysaccharide biosynthesis C-terminal domain-containing protein [Bacteroidota bacterium]